ncbi:MAG TPA: hypothetical protein VFR45_07820 [Nocardioides sp.]|jgi:hypothetical protein|nr:hypothetical protein [Nocardioides sp.]
MRILVATHHTNGDVPGDYDHCIDGELVYMQDPCASDRRDPDGPCGCGRGFAGTNSHRATSTALVVDSELTPADVDEAIRSSLETGGWLDPAHCTPQAARAIVRGAVDDMSAVARHFFAGTVVRRRINRYYDATRD